ncbi:MAG TPA: peptidylprolyl isomerase [Roseomonas sp.]|jgi:peptidyl-prolyl cis-trans isomerase SurA
MAMMTHPRFLSLLALGAALVVTPALAQRRAASPATAQTPAPPPGAGNRILAVVNGDVISRADVQSRRRLFALTSGLHGAADGASDGMDAQILRLLIDERLRLQEVNRRRIAITDDEIAGAMREIESRNGMPSGRLTADLRRANIEPRVMYDQVRVQIGWTRLLRALLGPQAEPSDGDVQEALGAARRRVGEPEFLVSEIFVPVDDPAKTAETQTFVDDVVARLRRGLPFPVAATQFSQAQTALQGGDLGWVKADQLDPAIASLVTRMPPGAVSNAVRVPGGWQIVALRQRRESGRDNATILSARQVFTPFPTPLNPQFPTPQQVQIVERARALSTSARSCDAMEAAARGSPRPADPGPIRLEQVNPPEFRTLLSGLAPGRASEPIIAPEGVVVLMVCSRETRNLAEITPDQIKNQLLRDRVELLSRQLQRDLRRRAQIEMRDTPRPASAPAERRG